MHKSLLIILFTVSIVLNINGQDCFDGYNKLFENGGDTLSYNAFHERELDFLENLNGCHAPDFIGTSMDDEEIMLSNLMGKVVVLNFWFTTCLPCLKEIPELNKLVDTYDPDEVVFIGLARDDEEKLNNFFNRFEPFLFKIIPETYDVATAYKIVEWPQTMVINKQGKVCRSWAGLHHDAVSQRSAIEQAINYCLSK